MARKQPRTRNPTDSTRRNITASHARDDKLAARIRKLERQVNALLEMVRLKRG